MESLLVYLGDGDTIKENAALLSEKNVGPCPVCRS